MVRNGRRLADANCTPCASITFCTHRISIVAGLFVFSAIDLISPIQKIHHRSTRRMQGFRTSGSYLPHDVDTGVPWGAGQRGHVLPPAHGLLARDRGVILRHPRNRTSLGGTFGLRTVWSCTPCGNRGCRCKPSAVHGYVLPLAPACGG